MYTEKYRPQFHFSPPSGWMNDPNGLIYHQGEYHLFYQYNPHSINWDSMHWGHAVSTDMVHWEHLPIAYEPEGPEDDYFTGSAVLDAQNVTGFFEPGKGGIVTVFTHRDQGVQQQSIGYSRDNCTFHRYEHCVLKNPGREDFRDPKVFWQAAKKRFLMTLAVYDHVEFYSSKDLKNWTYLSSFGQLEGSHQGVWECPDLFELPVEGTDEKRWVLLVGDQGASKTQYFIGRFEAHKFISEEPSQGKLLIDDGVDNYAGQTYNHMPDGRRVLIAWLNSTHLFNATPTSPWRSVYTIPREFSLRRTDKGIRLFQRPVKELEALRCEPVCVKNQQVDAAVTVAKLPPQFDAELVIDLAGSTAQQQGIKFCRGEKQEVAVGYDVQRSVIYLDRSLSGDMSYAPAIPPYLEAAVTPVDGTVTLRVLVDHSTVEVFAQNGEAVLSALIFPDPAQNGVQLFARKGVGNVRSLELYPMRSIWTKEAL